MSVYSKFSDSVTAINAFGHTPMYEHADTALRFSVAVQSSTFQSAVIS